MRCKGCGAAIDPETDRHLVVREELVAPELGLDGADGCYFCEDCMAPRAVRLEP